MRSPFILFDIVVMVNQRWSSGDDVVSFGFAHWPGVPSLTWTTPTASEFRC
jgi:hypothetical protein